MLPAAPGPPYRCHCPATYIQGVLCALARPCISPTHTSAVTPPQPCPPVMHACPFRSSSSNSLRADDQTQSTDSEYPCPRLGWLCSHLVSPVHTAAASSAAAAPAWPPVRSCTLRVLGPPGTRGCKAKQTGRRAAVGISRSSRGGQPRSTRAGGNSQHTHQWSALASADIPTPHLPSACDPPAVRGTLAVRAAAQDQAAPPTPSAARGSIAVRLHCGSASAVALVAQLAQSAVTACPTPLGEGVPVAWDSHGSSMAGRMARPRVRSLLSVVTHSHGSTACSGGRLRQPLPAAPPPLLARRQPPGK